MESNEIRGEPKYGDNSKEIIKNSTKDDKSNKSKESNINQFKDLINIPYFSIFLATHLNK